MAILSQNAIIKINSLINTARAVERDSIEGGFDKNFFFKFYKLFINAFVKEYFLKNIEKNLIY